jgi:hypothetical protein
MPAVQLNERERRVLRDMSELGTGEELLDSIEAQLEALIGELRQLAEELK